MTIYLTSDEHFGHRNIIAYCNRPFANVDEMTQGLVERHNAVVQKDDVVWHLGDFSLSEALVPIILPQLNGTHHLVPGNHDRCHSCHRKYEAAIKRYMGYGFASVNQEIRDFEGKFLLNHLPYIGDSGHEARYPEHRPKDEGSFLIHGHVHDTWKVNGRMINVGVDMWDYKPVPLSTILEIAK